MLIVYSENLSVTKIFFQRMFSWRTDSFLHLISRWIEKNYPYGVWVLLAAVVCYDEYLILTFIRANVSTFMHAQMIRVFTSDGWSKGPSLYAAFCENLFFFYPDSTLYPICYMKHGSMLYVANGICSGMNICFVALYRIFVTRSFLIKYILSTYFNLNWFWRNVDKIIL